MSDHDPSQQDEALSKLLKTWKQEAQLPPRFPEAVWRRIESAETAPSPGFSQTVSRWMERMLARPALAGSYVAILLFAGIGAGYWQAEGKAAHSRSEWRTRYVQTVDPYHMPRF